MELTNLQPSFEYCKLNLQIMTNMGFDEYSKWENFCKLKSFLEEILNRLEKQEKTESFSALYNNNYGSNFKKH